MINICPFCRMLARISYNKYLWSEKQQVICSIYSHLFSGFSKGFRLTLNKKKLSSSHCIAHVPFLLGLG